MGWNSKHTEVHHVTLPSGSLFHKDPSLGHDLPPPQAGLLRKGLLHQRTKLLTKLERPMWWKTNAMPSSLSKLSDGEQKRNDGDRGRQGEGPWPQDKSKGVITYVENQKGASLLERVYRAFKSLSFLLLCLAEQHFGQRFRWALWPSPSWETSALWWAKGEGGMADPERQS